MTEIINIASVNDRGQVPQDKKEFYDFVNEYLVDSSYSGHLPVPVYSYITPSGGIKFLLHILLSMGRFSTEINLTVNSTLRECFQKAKLIGDLNDEESLQQYSNFVLKRFIVEQLKYFSNSRRILAEWIVIAGEVLDSAIVRDEIKVTDMPSVQLTSLLASREEDKLKYVQEKRRITLESVVRELGLEAAQNLPNVEEVMIATKENPVRWDPIESFKKSSRQSEESYKEQKFAIQHTVDAIDRYKNLYSENRVIKSIGIRGFPGGGKTWCSMYCLLYALSSGLSCVPTAMMAKRATQLGGVHWHKLFCIPPDKHLSIHRIAEKAIDTLEKNETKLNFVKVLDVIVADELGQLSAEFVATIDIILRKIRSSNVIFGGVLLIGTLDHTQIQPWEGRPFLTSPQLIPCFKMIGLKYSVRTSNMAMHRMAEIARMKYTALEQDPSLANEFILLASEHFTFTTTWNDDVISPSTFRVYSKRVPAVEAAKQFVDNVYRVIRDQNERRERRSEDTEKTRFSRGDWQTASSQTTLKLEEKVKTPNRLLFFKGAVYECTYNEDGKFDQAQIAVLYDLPRQDDLNNWKKVKVLLAPPGWKDVDFDMTRAKSAFIEDKFREISIGVAPDRIISITRTIQGRRKQYGLRHRVTGTIHSAMGDTFESMATSISLTDSNFGLWDKGQLIVIISRTRDPKKTIFVGNKNDTLNAFRSLLKSRTQWTDFMEYLLDVITVNADSEEDLYTFSPVLYPFRICDLPLPQCRTGFVYMLSSLKQEGYTYVGKTKCLRTRINQHNSGFGSTSTEPTHLRPFAVMAYICGFENNDHLMLHVERKWKDNREMLIRNDIMDTRVWARGGQDVINRLDVERFGVQQSDLRLVLLFKDNEDA